MIITENKVTGTHTITVNGAELQGLKEGAWSWALYLIDLKRKKQGHEDWKLGDDFEEKLRRAVNVSTALGNANLSDLL